MKKEEFRVQVVKFVNAKRDKVFDAWTKPELMKRWSCPADLTIGAIEADVRLGGRFRTEMIGRDEVHTATGVYEKVTTNEKLVFTHGWEGPDRIETLVTVEFRDKDGGTEITVTHERLKDANSAKGHEQGWISTLENLAKKMT
jgi:uncharacterized protein YndB with AHSA1/START domain